MAGPEPAIAKATNLSRQTIYRIKDNPAAAEAALTLWGVMMIELRHIDPAKNMRALLITKSPNRLRQSTQSFET
jgi:hypothetical protein